MTESNNIPLLLLYCMADGTTKVFRIDWWHLAGYVLVSRNIIGLFLRESSLKIHLCTIRRSKEKPSLST